MHDPPDSRARCFSSVQCQRTAQSSGALIGAMARRCQRFSTIPAGSQIKCYCMGGQAGLGARPVEVGFECGWRLLPSSPDQYLSRRYHFGHSESSSSLTPHPILAAPFVEVPSPNPIGSPSGGRTHRVCHHHVPGHCQLLTRSPKDLLSDGRNISGLIINLTLLPARDALRLFVPAACWLSLQPQPIGSRDGRKKEEELSGRTGRAS